jgi:hypothetical protein
MSKIIKDYTESVTNIVTTDASIEISTHEAESIVVQVVADVNTPPAGDFTAAVTDICTLTAHGFTTGLKVRLTTTDTLPAGLSLATDYFVIVLSVNTFKLASSLVNALAGTPIDITDVGTGTHTITPTSIAGGVVHLEESNDGVNYHDIAGITANITADGSSLLKVTAPNCKYVRVHFTLTAGRLSANCHIVIKDQE